MLDAKIRGEGLRTEPEPAYSDTNVVDLMAALRRSLGAPPPDVAGNERRAVKGAGGKRTAAAAERARSQPALKLPLQGGKKADEAAATTGLERPSRPNRRKAS